MSFNDQKGLPQNSCSPAKTGVHLPISIKEKKSEDFPKQASSHRKWGAFRYSVIGPLLSSPPEAGKLGEAIKDLSERCWKHPITGEDVYFAPATIEGWYYRSKNDRTEPVASLNRKKRKDRGTQRVIQSLLERLLKKQYQEHPWWTVELHHKNLVISLKKDAPELFPPSYSTVLRYMRKEGLKKIPRPRVNENGELDNIQAPEKKEIALFEASFVNELWSLDFHKGKFRVLDSDGKWLQPICCAIMDHHSRLICHAWWGFFESTEELVRCYSGAVMKRGRPRKSLSDNGGAMKSGEFRQGLSRLGITEKWIKPRTPRQNGKTECFWNALESNLVDMLRGQKDLSLANLNKATQAWIEIGYNRQNHREIDVRPIDLFISSKNVGLPAVDEDTLRRAFRIEETRCPRSSDGIIRIEKIPFRLPERFQHRREVLIRYARWDLGFVHLVDEVSGKELERIFPVDKQVNATGKRRKLENPIVISEEKNRSELPPLLREQIKSYENITGMSLGLEG